MNADSQNGGKRDHETELRENLLNAHVGMRFRVRREMLGIAIEDAAHLLGFTPGELRAVEQGRLALTVPQLHRSAAAFEIPMSWFYDGAKIDMHVEYATTDVSPRVVASGLEAREQIELISQYFEQMDRPSRTKLLEIARLLAETCIKPQN